MKGENPTADCMPQSLICEKNATVFLNRYPWEKGALLRDNMDHLVTRLSRCQYQGWMKVIDMKSSSTNWISCGQPFTEPAIWKHKFCIVSDCQLLILNKQEIHPLLLPECRVEPITVWILRHTLTVPTDNHALGHHNMWSTQLNHGDTRNVFFGTQSDSVKL
ncbi:hypothetical protein DPEC_G00124550 [Dallia pectoralis]|uniref:Uncharacterized protein n=1 Tax=Dallia pectoralis TaxID=75939 RepID=A0ACC2GRI7_DALPE|nr:hypothetical protein DPEC_G00124550 [Dallia pectoralis]